MFNSYIPRHVYKPLLIILLCAITSCGLNQNSKLLDLAEKLIVENPDSTKVILSNINQESLDQTQREQFNILSLELDYRLSGIIDSLKLKNTLHYYEKNGDSNRLGRAYYIKANIELDSMDNEDAGKNLLMAYEYLDKSNDSIRMALTLQSLGDVYDHLLNKELAQQYYKKSYYIFRKLKSKRYLIYSMYDVARSSHNNFKYNEALAMCDTILNYINIHNMNFDMMPNVYFIKGSSQTSLAKYKDAITTYAIVDSIMNGNLPERDIVNMGISYFGINDINALEECCKRAPNNNWLQYIHSLAIKDDSQALIKLQNAWLEQSKDAKNLASTDDVTFFQEYNQLKTEKEQLEKESRRNRNLFIICFICIVVTLIVLLLIYNITRLKKDLLEKRLDLNNISNRLSKLQNDFNYLKNSSSKGQEVAENLTNLMGKVVSFSTKMDPDLENIEVNGNRELHNLDNLFISFKQSLLNDDFFNTMKTAANIIHNNIIDKFEEEIPRISDSDLKIFICSIMGFSAKEMGFLIGVPVKVIYSRRKNLKSKIIKTNSPSSSQFLKLY